MPQKITLVTGANRGIGKEVARQMADLGYTVLVTARSLQKAQATAAELGQTMVRAAARQRNLQRDLISGETQLVDVTDDGRVKFLANGLIVGSASKDTFTIVENDPLSASVRCEHKIEMQRDEWQIKIETSSLMTADAKHLYVSNALDAYEGNTRVFTKSWHKKFPRKLV